MANTGTGNWATGLQVQQWALDLWKETNKTLFWGKFMGKSHNNIIQIRDELSGPKTGYKANFGLIRRLDSGNGTGVAGDATLEGNENQTKVDNYSVIVDQLRNAIRSEGMTFEKKYVYDFRESSRDRLSIWLAEVMDVGYFSAITLSPTRVLSAKTAASASTNMDLAEVSKMKLNAKRSVSDHQRLRPINIKGKTYFLMVMSSELAYDLKQDSAYQQAYREAQVRGDQNELFNDSLGLWDGVIMFEHEDMETGTDGGGASVKYGTAAILGGQAMVFASGKEKEWTEKKFDYGNKLGVSIGIMYNKYDSSATGGNIKSVYDSKDFATLVTYKGVSADAAAVTGL